MPADLGTDAAQMAGCGLIMAAVAVPVGLAARFIRQHNRQPIFLRPARWLVPWGGFELLVLFAFSAAAPAAFIDPLLTATGFYPAIYGPNELEATWTPMRPLWSSVIFVPLFVGFLWWIVRLAYPTWRAAPAAPAARVAGGVGTWLLLHPLVAVVYFAIVAVFLAQGWQPDSHPLEKSFRDGRPVLDDVVFAIQAAIAAPLLEEIVFRGAILPWLLGKRFRPAVLMLISTAFGVAFSIQQVDGETSLRLGPAIFAALLLAIGAALHFKLKHHRRTVGAIYVSASFFAIVHSPVWPSPIPLFLLGLGLGWLAVRTRGFIAPAIVHGLFNGVSVLFMLRG